MAKPNPHGSFERYLQDFAADFDLDCRVAYSLYDCTYQVRFSDRHPDPSKRKHAQRRITETELESVPTDLRQQFADFIGNDLVAALC